MIEDPERCYQAARSKDARFDGWFYVAVTSTGIYCRPSCPARTPNRQNMRYYATSAAAQRDGFRACLRCRPEASPGSPEWNARADVVARAMRLIRDGIVDREGVDGLARRLGYSARQLNRLVTAELGTGPLALARAQRGQSARILLETTELSVAEVAFAAGFSSIRQCNETIRQVFADTPRGLRRRAGAPSRRRGAGAGGPDRTLGLDGRSSGIRLRLAARRPFTGAPLLAFLGARAVPGVEHFDGARYARSLRLPHGPGVVTVSAFDTDGSPAYLEAVLNLSDQRDLTTAVSRCRQLFDLDADPAAIVDALGSDRFVGPLVTAHPGRRMPGGPDGYEMAVRGVVGQQVSLAGARTVAGRLVAAAGEQLAEPVSGVTHLFPAPGALALLGRDRPDAFGMPGSRRRTIAGLAEAVADGRIVIDAGTDPVELRSELVALPGIGPWTAEYVAMRGLRDPDAFLPTDIGLKRSLRILGGPDDKAGLTRVSEAWRPWRSYAMAYLWSVSAPPSMKRLPDQKGRAA